MNNANDKLHLNTEKGWLGGVCAGIADYFEIEPFIVRIIAVVATLTWSLTILAYIVLYFVMSKKRPNIKEMGDQFSNSKIGNSGIGKHFKNIDYKKRIYKSRYDKKISGVCAGLANYFETSPFFIRLAFVLSLFFGPFAILAYIIAAIIMDVEPRNNVSSSYRSRSNRSTMYTSSYTDYDDYDTDSYKSTREQRKEAKKEARRERRAERHQRKYTRNHFANENATNPPYNKRIDKRDIRDCDKTFSDLEQKLQKLEATITSKKFRLHNEIKRMAT